MAKRPTTRSAPSVADAITIVGAREHNLKNVSLSIPRNKLVVLTGLSGSGKSSLAFDTIYAEGQRRYVESLSSYARQFLGLMEKPDVDYIEGLSPAISIDQKSASRNPRSTVGTVTEIYDYLRLLFSRAGIPHCPNCGRVVEKQSPQTIVQHVTEWLAGDREHPAFLHPGGLPTGQAGGDSDPHPHARNGRGVPKRGEGGRPEAKDQKPKPKNLPAMRIAVLAPLVADKKGEHKHVFVVVRKAGFERIRVNGEILDLDEAEGLDLDKQKRHSIEAVVDRLVFDPKRDDPEFSRRLFESSEKALRLGGGQLVIFNFESEEERVFSEHFACPVCKIHFEELQPRNFSFNSPHGACSTCQGLGSRLEVEPDLVIPNKNLTLAEGAIRPWARSASHDNWYVKVLTEVAKRHKFSIDEPIKDLSETAILTVLNGTGDEKYSVYGYETAFEGVVPNLMRRYKETESDYVRGEIEKYMIERTCPTCNGARLRPEVLGVTINDTNIVTVSKMTIDQARAFFDQLAGKQSPLTAREATIARAILKEITVRLEFLVNVGLSYLTLDRNASTLAGGEAQRIRLATQIGSGLTGVLYVLDEPSIGLHSRDQSRLIETLKRLRDLGNTVLVVEHDEETMRTADYIFDIGPGAGEHGGQITAEGTPEQLMKNHKSITGQYLSGVKSIEVPKLRRTGSGNFLEVIEATEHNLKNLNVKIPLQTFTVVTGVSGSGKSTLITDILAQALSVQFHRARLVPGTHKELKGTEHLDKVIDIDQSPIGRTPRSNPATYTGVFTPIRELFSATPEARIRGYRPGRFSFNVKGGRCETCAGDGLIKIEMHFLPDVYVTCEECKGKRYNEEALEILYKGKTISDVLSMTVDEALAFFDSIPAIKEKLLTLAAVGLGYLRLGQSATTLSGGEAQRIKLSTELARRSTGRTLYILDEPTTGLHFEDIKRLLSVLQALVDRGNTVLVIEHNLDVIKSADHVIDLGPEGGDGGGQIVAQGTPEVVASVKESLTGQYLKSLLARTATRPITAKAELTPSLAR